MSTPREPSDGEAMEAIEPISHESLLWLFDDIEDRCRHIETHIDEVDFATVMSEVKDIAMQLNLAYHVAELLHVEQARAN